MSKELQQKRHVVITDDQKGREEDAGTRKEDPGAFEAIVREHQRMVHSLCFRMTGSVEEAEDLAQETFLRAFRQFSSFRGEAKLSSWLCRIAINASLNWRQREGRRHEIHNRWAADALTGAIPDPTPDSGEHAARIQAALARLPAKQRAAIVLTVYEEMNHAQAARILGCTEATVSWRVFMARNKLKRWLQPLSDE